MFFGGCDRGGQQARFMSSSRCFLHGDPSFHSHKQNEWKEGWAGQDWCKEKHGKGQESWTNEEGGMVAKMGCDRKGWIWAGVNMKWSGNWEGWGLSGMG